MNTSGPVFPAGGQVSLSFLVVSGRLKGKGKFPKRLGNMLGSTGTSPSRTTTSTASKSSLLLKTHPTMPLKPVIKENTALKRDRVFELVCIE